MLRRRVNHIDLEGNGAGIGDIVPFPGGDENGVVIVNILYEIQLFRCIPHLCNPLAFLDPYKLVGVRMDLESDIFSNGNAHQGNLKMFPCP
ncbi:hypothetical protein D3C81_2177040 [compost metagenome]